MATKLQLISTLFEQTAGQVTNNAESWKDYLNTAARLYKYSFDDQLLIHAQRPDATACAFMEQWNGKMNRWVKPGSKGIALIHKSAGRPRLEYVFDVSDTRPVRGAKTPWLWEMQEEHQAPVLEKLEQLYGSVPDADFGERLMELAARAVGETYREALHDLEYDIGDSFLEGLDDLNLDVRFRDTLTASVQYTLLTRCGLDASDYLDDDDLRGITEFSTTTVLSHLGNACTAISSELLLEIGRTIKEFDRENLQNGLAKSNVIDYTKNTESFITLKYERSSQNGQIDIQVERGLPDSGPLDGRGGRDGGNAAGQVRDVAADLFAGEAQGDVHLDADDEPVVAAPTGNRPDSPSEGGRDADRADEAERRGREAESIRPDEVGAGSEQSESASGGNRSQRAGLQLNQTERETVGGEPAVFASQGEHFGQIALFPTVEGQIENIVQAQAEEKSSAFSFPPRASVSQEVIDRILTSGSNGWHSIERIVANFQTERTGSAHVSFLQKEYKEGGKGFRIDGCDYAAWFDKDCLRIAPGRTVNSSRCITIPWVDVAVRIGQLLQDGQFAAQERIDAARGNECKELAESLWYLRQDFADEAQEQGFMPTISELYGGFPLSTAKIALLLEDVTQRTTILAELKEFAEAHQNDPKLMRFRFYNPKAIFERLSDLRQTPTQFTAAADFKAERPNFVTQDEIDTMLAGDGYSETKMQIYSYFVQGHDLKERVAFLKSEYGIGGGGHLGYNENHDSKGISLRRDDEFSDYKGYDTVRLNWNQVDKRIGELIKANRFLSNEGMERIPEYEALVVARQVYAFYRYAPTDEPKGYSWDWDSDAAERDYVPKLQDPVQAEALLADMQNILATAVIESRYLETMQSATAAVESYVNGTYFLFTPLPPEQLQAERDKKEAARAQKKLELADDDGEIDDLAAAARALSRKKPSKTNENDNGQLSFDFTAQSNAPQPEVDTIADEETTLEQEIADVQNEQQEPPTQPEVKIPEAVPVPSTPHTKLYRESLTQLIEMVRWNSDYSYLRSEDTDYTEAENKLELGIGRYIQKIAEQQPDLYEAYTSLPLFREWMIEDILKFTYQVDTITDYRDAVARHAGEADAPNWLRESEVSPVQPETPTPELLTPQTQAKRELPTLNADAYLNLKAQHPDKIIGVHVDGMTIYYGTDAETAAPALGKKLVTREVAGLGETSITGTAHGWQADLVKLLDKGNSVLFVGEDGMGGYETIKERTAAEYIPIGMKLTMDGRSMQIDSVDFTAGTVSLRDLDIPNYPIFRSESIPFVRSFIEEQQFTAENVQQSITETSPEQASSLDRAKEVIADFSQAEYDSEADFSDLENIGLAYTTTEDEQHDIQVVADLLHFKMNYYANDVCIKTDSYATLDEMIAQELTYLDFESMIGRAMDALDTAPTVPEPTPSLVEIEGGEIRSEVVGVYDKGLPFEVVIQKMSFGPERHNFHITDNDLGAGGQKAKYQANIAAIRTLQTIEANNRLATPEEQETLSKYVGWGGIADAFDPTRENWGKEYAELKELLTPAEYESARSSVLNAHYTSPTVIRAIYSAVERMDFKPGNVLEPAMGVGNFFGLLPESMAASKLYGVELDSLTGRIAKQLYQKADITVAGFETTDRRDFYDLTVGNVPFGEYKVADRAYNKLGFSIHDYFLAKSLDQLRPGGIMAVITSRYTMDKKGTEVRKYLAQKGDLLGAVRLPNNAFKANAGTEVVSDILFFQKRDRAPEREPDWVQTGKTADDLTLNNYFLQHPEMVLGELTTKSTQYGNQELTVAPIPDADLSSQLAEAITHIEAPNRELLEADIPTQEPRTSAADGKAQRESLPADPNVRNFSYTLVDGDLYFRENSRMNPVEMGVTPAARVRGMVGLRDSARRLIDLQLQGAPDAEIDKEQVNLNTLYDKFGKQYGLINSLANKQAFEQDSAYPLLCSLEIIDEEGKLEKKADMFTKRTIQRPHAVTSVDTASEALAVSIGEKACVDIGYMGALMGGSDKIEGIIKDLQGVIFKDPLSDPNDLHTGWQTADEYLSGNVREKLAIAREAAETHPKYIVNVEKLEQVQPKELSAAEIDVRIGATWIDPKYYAQFMFDLLHTPSHLQDSKIDIRYAPINGEWNVRGKSEDSKNNARAYATYGTKRISAYAIIENALNLRDTRIFDTKYEDGKEVRVLNPRETAIAQQKQEAIGEAFRDWIFKTPERREELCKTYNELYNSTRPREFDGSHINYVGMNPEIHMRPHQSNAVAHMLYGHNTLLAHCVGAGKTFEMIAAALESKRLGLCQKSLFVVPNHLTEQWGGDFLRLYPGANVLVATKKDFEKANRKKFCARIATGDYDAVIIGHSQFEKIPLSAARQEAIIQDEISEIMDAIQDAKDNDGERYTIKQMEKSKKSLEARLTKLAADEKKDSVVTFEELGVDKLFVDEAHGFKNLFLHTKMRNVAGIGQSEAQKSSDMFGKCRYMDELTGGRGVTFATGTPVSNSMIELYTMMRYLQYDTLQKQGLGHFDSWAANFGEKVTAIELSPEGTGFRAKTRFAKFFNLPELMNLWKEAADIQTADMLKLPVPKAEYITVTTEPSEHQQAMVADLADRAKDVRDRKVEPNVDNMLRITGDGRKLALDQRLQNDLLPDDPDSKVNACVGNVFNVWEESTDIKGAQLIFCDLSTPHYDGTFNVYDDIKNKLIEKGVPPQEIAFIHDANTETQKAELFAKVRRGQVRVLIGSTQKMGAGTNVQDRLVASHDLDCPWRPADLEQRAGRILRQGNLNESVKMFKYVTKGTFDAYNWSLVENKQKFIGQIMTSKSPARSAEDIDAIALSYAEVKALATGDARFKEKMDLDIQVAKLKLLKSNHIAQQYEMEDKVVKYYPQKIAETKLYIEALTADFPVLEAHPVQEDVFAMTVMGKVYTERKEAGEAIIAVCKTMTDPDQKIELGEFRGFPLKLSLDGEKFKVTMKQNLTYTAELSADPSGNITRINNALEKIPESLQNHKERLVALENELASAKEEAARPFPKETEFSEKSARLNQLNIELDIDGKGQNGEEPERENETAAPSRDSGAKPSILKALRQFEAPAPTQPDRGRSHDREVI